MSDSTPEETAEFWEAHCWSKRFDGTPCAAPATWRGPAGSSAFTDAWRACDRHRVPGDVPR